MRGFNRVSNGDPAAGARYPHEFPCSDESVCSGSAVLPETSAFAWSPSLRCASAITTRAIGLSIALTMSESGNTRAISSSRITVVRSVVARPPATISDPSAESKILGASITLRSGAPASPSLSRRIRNALAMQSEQMHPSLPLICHRTCALVLEQRTHRVSIDSARDRNMPEYGAVPRASGSRSGRSGRRISPQRHLDLRCIAKRLRSHTCRSAPQAHDPVARRHGCGGLPTL